MSKKNKLTVAIVFLILGIVVFPVGSFIYIKSGSDSVKVNLPGDVELNCPVANDYVLWFNYEKGQTLKTLNGEFSIQLVRKSDSMTIPVDINENAFAVNKGNYSSIPFASFKLERPGLYELSLKDIETDGYFSFGKSRSLSIMLALAIGLLGCVLSIVVACVLLAVTYVPVFQNKKMNLSKK